MEAKCVGYLACGGLFLKKPFVLETGRSFVKDIAVTAEGQLRDCRAF